jgi:hypothetical protein
MGWDFCALLRYDGPSPAVADALARFESGDVCAPLKALVACARSRDCRTVAETWYAVPAWRSFSEWSDDVILPVRPELPTLNAVLDLPASFELMFGADTVRVYNLLRWLTFLTETSWRRPVLDALKMFCESFLAKECIVAHHQHPAMIAFLGGSSFDQSLQVAAERDEGEVQSLDQLFIDSGFDEQFGLPIWNSHGYQRFPLNSS